MYIAAEHIQRWIEDGSATSVSRDLSALLDTHLRSLPWSGGGLDWTRIEGKKISLANLDDTERFSEISKTCLSNAPCLVFLFSPDQAGLACSFQFGLPRLEEAFWLAPGKRYLFAGSLIDKEFHPRLNCFAEYDGADTLIVACHEAEDDGLNSTGQ